MDTVSIRDPYSRLCLLLETASFMHQRAWIALESDVYWMAGLHDQGAPHTLAVRSAPSRARHPDIEAEESHSL